jgi:hypothetical protein
MRSNRILLIIFLLLCVVSLATAVYAHLGLPPRLAVHFDAHGKPKWVGDEQ